MTSASALASVPSRQPSASPLTSDGISGASHRLRALAALSGSLTDALGPSDAADLVEQKALSALDATSAVVVTLGAFPRSGGISPAALHHPEVLHVVHAIGLPGEIQAALEDLPLDAPVPFAEVARIGAPLFLPSEVEMRRYPDWGAAMIGAGTRAAAIVPVWANGELRGVLGLAWAAPRIFDEDERAFVLTLGVMCAQAIMRAHLRDAECVARQLAETEKASADIARDIADHANRSKANFVAAISHELRTPINAVLGYAALLAEEVSGTINALQQDHIGRMRASGLHLLGLIEDLLGYARVEAGQEIVHAENVILLDVVESSLTLVRPLASKKGLSIRVEGPKESVALFTDVQKVRQILVNLIANAVKFTVAGEIVLVLRVAGTDDAMRVMFEVTDPGRGMTGDEQAHVFDPFWQAKETKPNTLGGTGLGLSVTQHLARMLSGDVAVSQSAIGVGSTFVVSLPVRYVVRM